MKKLAYWVGSLVILGAAAYGVLRVWLLYRGRNRTALVDHIARTARARLEDSRVTYRVRVFAAEQARKDIQGKLLNVLAIQDEQVRREALAELYRRLE